MFLAGLTLSSIFPLFMVPEDYYLVHLMILSKLVGYFPMYIAYSNGYYVDSCLLFVATTTTLYIAGVFYRSDSYNISPRLLCGNHWTQQLDIYIKTLLLIRLTVVLKFYDVVFDSDEINLFYLGLAFLLYSELIVSRKIGCGWLKWSPDLFHIWTNILDSVRGKLAPSNNYYRTILYAGCHSIWVLIGGALIGYVYQKI